MHTIHTPIAFAVCVLALVGDGANRSSASSQTVHAISQIGRVFRPAEISLGVRENLYIKNDDGDFVHDVYVESPDFNFESGDINPGDTAVIAFPLEGDFTVLCGVHPSMKLAVHVRSTVEAKSR